MARVKSKDGDYQEEEKLFDDLGELIDYLLELRLPKDKDKEKDNEFWSFRGQRDEGWALTIDPHENAKSDHQNKTSGTEPKNIDHYDQGFLQYKKRMAHSRGHDYLNDANPWWWLFYAEHHGLHTRLLDWTSNPLVAIYFAVENILSQQKNDDIGGAVWALKVNKKHFRTAEETLKTYKLDPSSGRMMDEKEWFMINPEPVTERIVLQSGKFSYHPGRNPTPIERMDRRKGEELIKIKIAPKNNADIRKGLGIMNIHHGSLFPSPTGIAHFVNQEWPDIAKY